LTSLGIGILGDKGIGKAGAIAKTVRQAGKGEKALPIYTPVQTPAFAQGSVPYNVLHDPLMKIKMVTDDVFGAKGKGNVNRLIPGKPGVVTGGNSNKLGKNMLEDMGIKRSKKWSGYQAQHIIPSEMANNPIIQKIGMNFDDSTNGIFLRVPDNDISAMSRHRGYHSVYNEVVERALNRMDINQSVDNLQKQVYDLQSNLRKLQENGLPLYPSQGATVELWKRKLKQSEK